MNRRPFPLLLAVEVALAVLSVAAVLGFERVFDDNSWRRALVLAAVAAHVAAAVLRRLRLPLLALAAFHLVLGLLVVTWLHARDTTRALLPTGGSFRSLGDDISSSVDSFKDAIAPTDPETGYLILATMAIWVLALLADLAAFWVRSAFEAVLPSAALLVFVSIFGVDENRLLLTGLFLFAAVGFVALHRVGLQLGSSLWLGSRTRATASLLRGALGLGVAAGLFALALAPTVPSSDTPLVDIKEDGGPGSGTRVVVSPLVDIRGRLIEQADIEVFTVRADRRAYWRLTALDSFDGDVWTSRANYDDANGSLSQDTVSGTTTDVVTQEYTISGLAAVWLPTAFQATRVDADDAVELSWEPVSGTLIVGTGRRSSDELTYRVESALPRFDPVALGRAGSAVPPELVSFLEVPDDFSPTARALAQDLTAGATNPYDAALALQNYFQQNFAYDVTVSSGHGSSRVDDFLSSGRGYCEQFAGTFAAMARSIGLPTRVAVGFTPGDVDPSDRTLFVVRGEHAHAWPEVFIEGAGWVAFEPTPGRGAPGAVAYTGIPEQQDTSGPSTTPTTLSPNLAEDFELPNPEDFAPDAPEDLDTTSAQGSQSDGGRSGWATAAYVLLALIAVAALAIPVVRRWERGRRTSGLDGNRATILAAWEEAVDRLGVVCAPKTTHETPLEFAIRVERELALSGAMARLATASTQALYSERQPDDAVTASAVAASDQVAAHARERSGTLDRMKAEMDPRSLIDALRR